MSTERQVNVPKLPESITRAQVIQACEVLGLDAKEVSHLIMDGNSSSVYVTLKANTKGAHVTVSGRIKIGRTPAERATTEVVIEGTIERGVE